MILSAFGHTISFSLGLELGFLYVYISIGICHTATTKGLAEKTLPIHL
tara:strand:- start:1009 stop:1152 length:144 start_codon:yes stop_codon:yes gene_type:complete